MRFFSKSIDKLRGALKKTAEVLNTDVRTLFVPGRQIDVAFLEELERKLLRADVGAQNAMAVRGAVEDMWRRQGKIKNAEQAADVVRQKLLENWPEPAARELAEAADGPTVIMVCGVNGAGKTTSIAKLAGALRERGKTVMLAAGDTFRAAAVEQLTIWADRLGVEIIKQKQGADPAAVAYSACEAAVARGVDYLIVDTAGRLHTQANLMAELAKIRRILGKKIENAPHETLLVLDATTGQNAVRQATEFTKIAEVTGIFLAKLDGSAKGGAVFGIRDTLGTPIKFIGLGETPADVESFDPERFIDALLGTTR
jgi:fused signal recognition particle receptor